MNFVSIRLSTMRPNLVIPFNVYIKVANNYVHYLCEGDDIDFNRLDSLRSKGLRKFYINEEDELKYQAFISTYLENIKISSDEAKTSLALEVTEKSAYRVLRDPATEVSSKMAQASSGIVQKILSSNNAILREMVSHGRNANSTLSNRIQAHLSNTASISIKFAESLDSNINTTTLGLAAYYHDVSFMQYPPGEQSLFFKEIKEMSATELQAYKNHPEKSVQVLQDKAFADKEVVDLIMAHEENVSGQGFPKKLTKLTLSQEVLSLCAFYDREITCLGKDPDQLYANLMIDQVGIYNLELLKKFKSFVKNYL